MFLIKDDIYYTGINDHITDLFEGQYIVPNGMAYNSYVVLDEKIAVFDTVDNRFTDDWFIELDKVLQGKSPDYLIVQHMEPDHSGSIDAFLAKYPEAKIVGNTKTFNMISQFFGEDYKTKSIVVNDGDTLCTGKHTFNFVFAPMVHWPEVMVTYDSFSKVLFSADGFGKFGALDTDEEWDCEARRYYFGIVGKYGIQVQSLLKKAANLDIEIIAPLHGPVLKENLSHYINLYDIWSSYKSETDGVFIAYSSVYGNTKKAVLTLEKLLTEKGVKVSVSDLARTDMAENIEDAFRYSKIVFATTTYNGDVFPVMKTFIDGLVERSFQNKKVAVIENGTWAPVAAKKIKSYLENSKNLEWTNTTVSIKSALNDENYLQINTLAEELK